MIALATYLPTAQTARSDPADHDPPAPSPDARTETIKRDPRDTATLADEVCAAIARLLGRQAAREWFHAQEAEHGA